MLYSFDIFDTILYRTVPNATDIFLIMDNLKPVELVWHSKKHTFSDIRIRTEFLLRRILKREVTIEDIYKMIGKRHNLSKNQQQELMQIEFQTERNYSFLHSKMVRQIKKLKSEGASVILISDMYWHEKDVRNILIEKDPFFVDIPIYVSSDLGVTKKNKKLYKLISERLNVSFEEWEHIGDNKKSDFENASSLGIKAFLVKKPARYYFETHLPLSIEEKKVYELIVRTRELSTGAEYDLGASFAAPMVYQYVCWILKKTVEKRINKLYFVLRDGYILKKVADVIIQNRGLDITTEYLFGSRVAWRFPEVSIDKLKNMSVWDKSNWIFREPSYAYVPFERLGVSKELLSVLMGEDFCQKEYYSFSDFKNGLNEALANVNFCKIFDENVRKAGENLSRYLIQSLDEKSNYALVDTNSTGKTQHDLENFIKKNELPLTRLKVFYHTFLSDKEPDPETQFVYVNAKEQDRRFPEALFRAPYNPCYGYYEDGNYLEPTFFKGQHCAWNYSFLYDEYLKGIIDFTAEIEKSHHSYDIDSYVDVLMKVANFDIVSDDIIQQIAHLPFSPNMYGEEILDFYPEIQARSLVHPFSELIYYPKGSYFRAGGMWPQIYKVLDRMVKLKRNSKR